MIPSFRGKNVETGEWVYGHLIQGFRTYIVTAENMFYAVVSIDYMASLRFVEVDPKTAGMATGLKDKAGREIFEGDVVCDSVGSGVVVWNDSTAGFSIEVKNCEYRFYAFNKGETNRGIHLEETEVIGNIHENPELTEAAR